VHYIGDDKYAGWKKLAMEAEVTNGYCEANLNNMNAVSNQRICRSRVNSNIGFYFKIKFSLAKPATMYVHNPTDFGYGGVSAINGDVKAIANKDIYAGSDLDFNVNLPVGEHTIEVIGGEGCCDGTLKWWFKLQGDYPEHANGQPQDFTLRNLASMCPTSVAYPKSAACTENTQLMQVSPISTSGYLERGVMVIWAMEM